MDNLTYLFAVTVMLAGMLASISIWEPRKLWIRGASVIATAGLVVVAFGLLRPSQSTQAGDVERRRGTGTSLIRQRGRSNFYLT